MQNHRDVSPSRIKPGTYCLLDTLWSHWQMTCIINLNFMNKVVLFPSPPLVELIHEGEKFHQTVHHQHRSSSACSRHRHPQGLRHTWTCTAAVFQTMSCVCCGSNETTGKNKDKNGQRSQPADICEAAQRGV